MIPPHTKAISKQNTLLCVPQHGEGCFVSVRRPLKIFAKLRFRVDPIFLRRYNKKGYSQSSARRGCCGCGIYENWEVNAGQWTRIIVEDTDQLRHSRTKKQLRSPFLPGKRYCTGTSQRGERAQLGARSGQSGSLREAGGAFCFVCCPIRRKR